MIKLLPSLLEQMPMAIAIEDGLTTAITTILTMGSETGARAAAKTTINTAVKTGTKDSLKAGFKSMINVLKGPFKEFTIKKAKDKVKEFFKDQIKDKVTEVAISTVCGQIYNSLVDKEYTPPSDEDIGNKILESVDIFGIKDIVEGCQNIKDGGAACARSVVGSISTFDPTGILTIAAAFIHPSCDVPMTKPADTIADFEGNSTVAVSLATAKSNAIKKAQIDPSTLCVTVYDKINFKGNRNKL